MAKTKENTVTCKLMDPEDIKIIGIDLPVEACPDLHDPASNLEEVPEAAVISYVVHGVKTPVTYRMVKWEGQDYHVAEDGRRRIRGARRGNLDLVKHGNEFKIRIKAVAGNGDKLSGMIVANEHRREVSPLAKAQLAERLRTRNTPEAEIAEHFGGVSLITLANWSALLECVPEIQAKIQAGEISVSIGYELGKLAPAEQVPALAKILAEGGSLRGAKGRENVRAQREGGGGTKAPKVNAAQCRELFAILEPTETEPHDCEAQAVAYAVLAVVTGEDPHGEKLRAFPEVYKHVKRVLPSPPVPA